MPCFKGLAVSVHTPGGPLPEYSVQRLTKASKITAYIPVPPPKIIGNSSAQKQSTFSISVTLLTPGLSVPYSTPKATLEDPFPRPQLVGGLNSGDNYSGATTPYRPMTQSPNETIAAYIYFDGRPKEEVATLLRRGEETWVNSRWVSMPESEGGGLAERDFLFREVGLERWLNGLDLKGKDVAAKIERRRQKLDRKRRKKTDSSDSDDDCDGIVRWPKRDRFDKGVLRYGADEKTPLEKMSDDDDMFSLDEDSDDDPIPETTGQIKVALFRVLASGEIKKGEYSPQFDAHDDDEDSMKGEENGDGKGNEGDIDHTTSFAKPKTLDPKSISTQTVTGIDGPEKPYAVFTFLYRGEKQLQKMGILKSNKSSNTTPTINTAKRRSIQTDFANLKPLKAGGALGFIGMRDTASPKEKRGKKNTRDDLESDDEEEVAKDRDSDGEGDALNENMLSPEDVKKTGEIAEGVKKIKLKRAHSFEPPYLGPAAPIDNPAVNTTTPPSGLASDSPPYLLSNATYDPHALLDTPPEAMIGSPLKRHRASTSAVEEPFQKANVGSAIGGLGFAFSAGAVEGGFGGELNKEPVREGGGMDDVGDL